MDGLGHFDDRGNRNLRRPLPRVKAGALFALDGVDRRFETVAMMGDHIGIGDILLAQAGFQRLAGGLIDPRSNLRIVAFGILERCSDGRF